MSKKICGPLKTVPWCFSHSITRRKRGEKLLSPWEKPFFQTFVYVDLLGPKERFFLFGQSMSEPLVDPQKLFPDICHVRWKEMRQIFSSLEGLPSSWKLCVFNNLLGLKRWSDKFQSKGQNNLRTLILCSFMFFILDNTRKIRPKSFAIAKKAIFWKVCFCRPFRSQQIFLSIAQSTSKEPMDPQKIFPVSFHVR